MKRKYIGIAMLVCAIALFSSVVIVPPALAWDLDDLINMTGKIKKTFKMTKEIREKMGQGLVGEVDSGTYSMPGSTTTWEYYSYDAPHPKKFSFWISLWEMSAGDTIEVTISYETDFGWTDPVMKRTWSDAQDYPSKLVVDQLPVAGNVGVAIEYTNGGAGIDDVDYHAIIEEV